MMLVALFGLCIGGATRFEGRVILTEDQVFGGAPQEYLPDSIRAGLLGAPPTITMRLETVEPQIDETGSGLSGLRAVARVLRPGDSKQVTEEAELSRRPAFIQGSVLSLKNFGYSPFFRLKDETGKVLDESFVYLKLFPPGSVDSFRLMMPHTFYLSYFPPYGAATEGDGKAGAAREKYHLRVTRNKIILVDRDLEPGEEVTFDGAHMAFHPPRKWVEILFVRDYGLPLAVFAFALASVLFLAKVVTGRP